jgi:hypothetical protein
MYRGQELIEEEETPKGFNLVVDQRHPKSGLVIKSDPYTLRVIGSGEGKTWVFERPVGSGNLWNKSGDPIGRWDKSKPEGERFIAGAEHIAWTPPLTADQKLARSVIEKDGRIQELEKEIAAIKAEREKREGAQKNKGV